MPMQFFDHHVVRVSVAEMLETRAHGTHASVGLNGDDGIEHVRMQPCQLFGMVVFQEDLAFT